MSARTAERAFGQAHSAARVEGRWAWFLEAGGWPMMTFALLVHRWRDDDRGSPP
jgi:hypothetical protein